MSDTKRQLVFARDTREITYDEQIRVAKTQLSWSFIRDLIQKYIRSEYDIAEDAEFDISMNSYYDATITITEVLPDE